MRRLLRGGGTGTVGLRLRVACGGGLTAFVLVLGGATAAAPDNALQLDGVNDYVTFGSAAGSLGASQFTLEAWFMRAGASGVSVGTGTGGLSGALPLVTKGRAEADSPANLNMNYFLGLDAATNKLVADFEDTAGGGNHPVSAASGTLVASPNVWHHAAASYDGSMWRLYLDGKLDRAVNVGSFTPESTSIQHAAIGSALTSTGSAAGFFAGQIDEVRIWNVARTGAQIRANKDTEAPTPTTGLRGQWHLDEGSGTSAGDSSGQSVTGALVGGPTWVAGYTFPQDTTAPAAPQNLAATAANASVALSWSANGEPDLAGYNLWRSTSSPVDTSGSPLNGTDLIAPQKTSYSDSGLTNGTTYQYVLVAVDGSDNRSSASNQASATPAAGDPVLVGAGDIADCSRTQDSDTAALVAGISGAVFTLGDNAYPSGAATDFTNCYAPTWGIPSIKSRTRPTPGNHEYGDGTTPGATPYFDYFNGTGVQDGPAGPRGLGYYSYDIDENGSHWHVVVLNGECEPTTGFWQPGGCAAGSTQEQWLRNDLANASTNNIVAMFHKPRFSSSGSNSHLQALWQALYDYGADVVLSGHKHNYERFAPMNAAGVADPASGIRAFVVGTGGASLMSFVTPLGTSEVRDSATYGVLKLTLHASSYDWQFIPANGVFTDSGTSAVHGASTNVAPTATVSLSTTAPKTNDTLTATATKSDPNAQQVSLTYVWKVNGTVKRTSTSSTALTDTFTLATAGNGDRGDVIRVEVTPNDGVVDGTTASDQATVVNSAPLFSQDLQNRSDSEGAAITLPSPATDADSNTITYGATNLPPGLSIDASTGGISGTVAAGAANGSPYAVSVTASDGTDTATEMFTWIVTRTNHAPVVDSVTIVESAPKSNDILTLSVTAHDDDNDPLTYTYQWTKNGVDIAGATAATLNLATAGNGDKGDVIAVRVTASDGSATSPSRTSSAVTIQNSLPTATVSLSARTPGTNTVLTATATNGDPDGDVVTLTYIWKVNSSVRKTTASSSALTDTFDLGQAGNGDAGDVITVEVTPADGTASGAVVSDQATVDASAPATPSGLSTSVSSTAITLDWADNTGSGLAGYNVYRAISAQQSFTKLNGGLLTTSAYQDTSASAGGTYDYRVTAVNTTGSESQPATTTVFRGIAFRSAASAQSANASSLALPRPAGVVTGDALLAVIDVRGQTTITTPAGWALVRSDSSGNTLSQSVYVKVAGGAEPASYIWAFSGSQSASGAIVAYVGVHATSPVAAAGGSVNGNSTAITAPSVTTLVTDTLVVGLFGTATNATVTPPPGMTEQADVAAGGSQKVATEAADAPQQAAGATGTRVATASSAAVNIGQLVALRPVGAPAGGDTQPPTMPANVTANAVSSTQIDVTWSASTDNVAVDNYVVYRGGTPVGTTAQTHLSDVGLTPSTQYSYAVEAFDAAGNQSGQSAPATTTTTPAPPAGGAISFRAASSASNRGGTSLAIPRPNGAQSGDVLIASLDVGGSPALTAPTGWTLIRSDPASGAFSKATYWRMAGASEPASYTWTLASSQVLVGVILAYSGVDPANPIDVSSGQANPSSTSVVAPSVQVAAAGSMLVSLVGIASSGSVTPPSGMTERVESAVAGADKLTSEASDATAGAGTTGSRTATVSRAGVCVGQFVVLRKAP